MSDLDFSNPAPQGQAPAATRPVVESKSLYDPKMALAFFQIGGQLESFAAGAKIFAEHDKAGGFFSKGARLYLLVEGEVALTMQGKPLTLVMPGEIFGEMAVIADSPRSATAMARKNCRVLSLDEKGFLQSLQRAPEFALMMLSSMAQRLRAAIDKVAAAGKGSARHPTHKSALDRKMLEELRHAMGDPTPVAVKAGDTIINKGAAGVTMFVVVQGKVAITIDGLVVEHVGPGGTFGEMALLGQATRAASAVADEDSTWLSVGRKDFIAMIKSKPAFGVALMRSMSERILHASTLLAG